MLLLPVTSTAPEGRKVVMFSTDEFFSRRLELLEQLLRLNVSRLFISFHLPLNRVHLSITIAQAVPLFTETTRLMDLGLLRSMEPA